jgi:hypothetical protein
VPAGMGSGGGLRAPPLLLAAAAPLPPSRQLPSPTDTSHFWLPADSLGGTGWMYRGGSLGSAPARCAATAADAAVQPALPAPAAAPLPPVEALGCVSITPLAPLSPCSYTRMTDLLNMVLSRSREATSSTPGCRSAMGAPYLQVRGRAEGACESCKLQAGHIVRLSAACGDVPGVRWVSRCPRRCPGAVQGTHAYLHLWQHRIRRRAKHAPSSSSNLQPAAASSMDCLGKAPVTGPPDERHAQAPL